MRHLCTAIDCFIATSNLYWTVEIYDLNETLLARRRILGIGGSLTLSTGVDYGTYLIKVSSASYHTDVHYTLSTWVHEYDEGEPISMEIEGNGTLEEANLLSSGEPISGQLSSASDIDYFQIECSKEGVLTIETYLPG